MDQAPKSKLFKRIFYVGICAIGLFTISPIICMGLTWILSSGFGCAMGEDTYHPCVLLGIDFGPIIAYGSVGPFLLFLTFPAGIVAQFVFIMVMLLLNKKFKAI